MALNLRRPGTLTALMGFPHKNDITDNRFASHPLKRRTKGEKISGRSVSGGECGVNRNSGFRNSGTGVTADRMESDRPELQFSPERWAVFSALMNGHSLAFSPCHPPTVLIENHQHYPERC